MTTLFVGVTSWNSARFLSHSLDAVRRTVDERDLRLVVWDNVSRDGSAEIARRFGAEVVVRSRGQGDALNGLFALSRSRWTLLMHSDVVLLDGGWLDRCIEWIRKDRSALLSPEDVGCGPFTRPFGLEMPESSFLFMDTAKIRRCRSLLWRRWRRIRVPFLGLDLYGPHITHNLPRRLAARGERWRALDVQTSDSVDHILYGPYPGHGVWTEELGHLRYGLGNFYGLEGTITHYHNWYDRISDLETTSPDLVSRTGFPPAYIREYSERFLSDFRAGGLVVPTQSPRARAPRAL